ncbi:hypothetical protein KBB96_04770 [Luteolibacter ambystomatis]|uniref:Uncharacterized protein n=1 Tax=Luteolibacter ambystomatis TaxID=2824561 RepID=A0A975J1B5_9BACT|nr:hypothetical protein [Luteolibacter ambystomatis]QUE52206.1 hypothetical protein KBB96_04770 [Luteolibacter ambystomatis]
MSKQSDNVMLVPGESGWEIWSGSSATGFTLLSATGTSRASDITGLPSGDLTMLFPVRAITALPLKVTSEDPSLIGDMAVMYAERQGLRPDPMAGQLTDQFIVSQEGDQTTLLSAVLRPPGEGEMPPRGPKEFDLSARALPYQGDSLVVWKEFDRWVFAVSKGGKLLYCQATAVDAPNPDESFVREVRLSLIQLSLQGLDCNPARVVVYANAGADGAALSSLFGPGVIVQPKPAPVLPEPHSKLLPADVRAARRQAVRRQQTIAAVALIALLYLGGLGWVGYSYWKDSRTIKRLRAAASEVGPEREAYQQHIAKWDELAPVVDINKSPVELMYRVATAIPGNGGVRLKDADIDGTEIKLRGQGQQPAPIKQFDLALRKSDQLAGFTWVNQEPTQDNKVGWTFNFTGSAPGATGTKP